MTRTRILLALLLAGCIGALCGATGVAAATGPAALAALQEPSRTLDDGVYTGEQAERGAAVYRRACAECHRSDQYKGFLRRWTGLPVGFLYEVVRSTMPQNDPGTLSREEYADVLTYIFSINGVPTGEEEMDSEDESLQAIVITVPAEEEGS